MRILLAAAAGLLVLATGAFADTPSPEAAATIVLYNSNQPASLALAEYYAAKRDIPKNQLVGVPCSGDEEIDRDEYLVNIEAPLRRAFNRFEWWQLDRNSDGDEYVVSSKMRFVAVIRGVPLKIRPDGALPPPPLPEGFPPNSPMEMLLQHNEASVDSELSALFALRENLPAFLINPYYRRFTPILQVPPNQSPLLVCRLDGPSDALVRRMIDASIATERTGLWGWAYVDKRGIDSGNYATGDQWLSAAEDLMRRQGLPVITDAVSETLPEGFPMTDAAIYYGWYAGDVTGPFTQPNFRFVPGAVAFHLHSLSARTIRDPKVAWVAPLLDRGAAATLGNVYEPYLELTVHFDLLQDRLMNGLTLGEAAYASQRGLSWMGIVVGDPLYRPYGSWVSVDSGTDSPNIWQQYRAAVLSAGGPLAAADALHKLAETSGNSMPLEALGQAQAAAGKLDEGLATLDEAAAMTKSDTIRFRIALEQISLLRRADRQDAAITRVSTALKEFPSGLPQITLGRIAETLSPLHPPVP
ncbi:MAG TPA: TIGR03790 family protein [Chthoniobacterales bacterium]